jgi:hypothetical protein
MICLVCLAGLIGCIATKRAWVYIDTCVNNSYNHMNIFRNIDKSYCYIAETTSVECRYDNYESSGDNIICIVENGY